MQWGMERCKLWHASCHLQQTLAIQPVVQEERGNHSQVLLVRERLGHVSCGHADDAVVCLGLVPARGCLLLVLMLVTPAASIAQRLSSCLSCSSTSHLEFPSSWWRLTPCLSMNRHTQHQLGRS